MANAWISVNDELPINNYTVLFVAVYGSRVKIMVGHHEKGEWLSCGMFNTVSYLSKNIVVTHWQELPELPQEKVI